MDIKALSIQVQAKGVQQAANALGNLAKNAAQLDPVLTRAKAGLDTISKISLGSTNAQVKGTAESIQYLRNSTKEFSNIGQGFKGLSNSLTSVATSIEKLVTSTQGLATFNTQLQALKNTLSEMKGMSGVLTGIGTSAANASSRQAGGGGGSRYPADEAEKYAKVQQRLIANIEREAVITSQGKIAWLEMQAARKGVSEQAAPFITQLKAQSAVMGNATIGTKQYTAAMRMVPAQFTDIATQLAGGQNPMLILMQQGGQLKDMFGGVGAAAKAAGSYIMSLLTNPLVVAAGAFAALGYAVYRSADQLTEFNKAAAVTGNYIGISADEMKYLTTSMTGVVGTSGQISDALTAIASTSKISGNNIEALTASTVKFSRSSGVEIEKVVAEYASLSKKPSEALLDLNEKYHFLTASVYEQVRALEAQGKTQEATQIAQAALGQAQDEMTRKLVENAGAATKAWTKVKDVFSDVLDLMAKPFVDDSSLVELQKMEEGLAKLEANRGKWGGAAQAENERNISALQAKIALAKQEQTAKESVVKAEKDRQTYQQEGLRIQGEVNKLIAQSESPAAKKALLANEKARINLMYDRLEADKRSGDETAARTIEQLSRTQALADAEKKINKAKVDGGVDRLASLKAERDAIEIDISNIREQGNSYDKVTEAGKRLIAVKALLDSGKKDSKEVANLQAEKALLEQITQREQVRNNMQEDLKGAARWEEIRQKSEAATVGIEEHIQAIRNGESETSRMTATQKLLAQAQDEAAYSMDMLTRSAAANSVATLQNQVAKEALAKSEANSLKYKQETLTLDIQGRATLESMIAQYNLERDSINMSNRERQTANQLLQIESQKKQALAPLQAEMTRLTKAGSDATKEEVAALQAKIDKVNEVAGLQSKEASRQGGQRAQLEGKDFSTDAKTGFDNYYDSLTKRQDMFQQFYSNSTQLMTDSLETFFNTGKFSAKSFFADMLKMITKLIAQMLILRAVKTATGMYDTYSAKGSANGNVFGGGQHVNKYANGGALTNGVYNKPTYFANGGTLNVLGEEPGRSEAVMPLMRMSNGDLGVQTRGGGGGSGTTNNVSVVVNVASDGTSTTSTNSSAEDAKKMGEAIKAAVLSVIVEQKRPNGLLAT